MLAYFMGVYQVKGLHSTSREEAATSLTREVEATTRARVELDPNKFTVHLDHNGFFCGLKDDLCYVSGTEDYWDNCNTDAPITSSDPIQAMHLKLKATARALSSWGQRRVGNIREQLLLAQELVLRFDMAQDTRTLSWEEAWLRKELKKKILGLASLQRTMARQRSRLLWVKEVDENTTFFHAHASKRRRRNHMFKLKKGDREVCDQQSMESLATKFFEDLLGKARPRVEELNLDALGMSRLNLDDLEANFSEDEIWTVVRNLPADKSHGPDGFSAEFFQRCWATIKADVMAAIEQVTCHDSRSLHWLNQAYITLLPKKEDATDIKDFRPISLVHGFAKILSKALANRVAPRLKDLVFVNQSAFVKGRSIQDNFMLVDKSAKTLHRRKVPALFLKHHIARAFDSVSWPFLLKVMRRRGFGNKFCSWVAALLYSANTRVLFNGIPGEKIWHARGLRQGDPASPTWFILIMDVLNAVIGVAEEKGVFQDLRRWGIRHRLSLFADDAAMFIQPTKNEMLAARKLLDLFGNSSGMCCNLAKCAIAPIACPELDLQNITQPFPCQVTSFPCRYLGLPLSLKKLPKEELLALIENIHRKLATWKTHMLNSAGRLLLIKTVMEAIAVYHMLSMDLPPWVIKKINKICRSFLWHGAGETNGENCRVAWKQVCMPTKYGGLGLHNLKFLNDALRMRWRWFEKESSLRAWTGLQFKLSPEVESLFRAATACSVGRGDRLIFWEDRWLEGSSPSQIAPDMLQFVTARGAKKRTVAEALLDGRWVKDIRGYLTLPAIVQFVTLWCIIRELPPLSGEDDVFRWQLTANGSYTASSAYKAYFHGSIEVVYAKTLWKSRVPPKEKFFTWLVMRDRCWTANRLTKRGLQGPPRCTFCDQEPETLNHILTSCSFSKTFWFRLCQETKHPDFTPSGQNSVRDWWSETLSRYRKKQQKDAATLIITGMRALWLERNARVFEGKEKSMNMLISNVCEELSLWFLGSQRVDLREE